MCIGLEFEATPATYVSSIIITNDNFLVEAGQEIFRISELVLKGSWRSLELKYLTRLKYF